MDWKILRRTRSTPKDHVSILIVEDESSLRNLWRGWLIVLGYDVRTAEDARHAVSMVDQQPPHVAICDVHLPGPSGLWLADQIRTLSPATAIIYATGDRTIPPVESLRAGVIAYLVKPFSLQVLKDAVEAAVRWSCANE